MKFTFSQVNLECLELYDLNILIDETGFTQSPVSLCWDREAVEIYYHRDNAPDLLLNPIIPDGDWFLIFQELETLNFDNIQEYFQECREMDRWVRDPEKEY